MKTLQKTLPIKGEKITLSKFSFTNKSGGTGMSDWKYNEKFEKLADFEVIKSWDDYECGVRGWCTPDSTNVELMEYLKRNAKKGSYDKDLNFKEDKKGLFICYFSEFDVK